MTRSERWLRIVLLLGGLGSLGALPAVVMPRAWMSACHQWLGLGPLPAGPIVEYLARSLSAFYAFFGGLCVLISFHPRRHGAIVLYVGATHVVFAAVLLCVDLAAGMPLSWTVPEVLAAGGFGAVILLLHFGAKAKPQS